MLCLVRFDVFWGERNFIRDASVRLATLSSSGFDVTEDSSIDWPPGG